MAVEHLPGKIGTESSWKPGKGLAGMPDLHFMQNITYVLEILVAVSKRLLTQHSFYRSDFHLFQINVDICKLIWTLKMFILYMVLTHYYELCMCTK
jgi:hypothetical protein